MSVIIRLQLLPLSAAAADVRAFFHNLRIPDGAVHIVGGVDGDAFIGFASDEDARQAMRRTGQAIHGQEIKLYLSSRAEMNEVINRAKAMLLGQRVASPPPARPHSEQKPPEAMYEAVPIRAAPPAVSAAPPSAFAPDPAEFNKPAYMRQMEPPRHLEPPPPKRKEEYTRKPLNALPPAVREEQPAPRFFNGPIMSHSRGHAGQTNKIPPPSGRPPPRQDYTQAPPVGGIGSRNGHDGSNGMLHPPPVRRPLGIPPPAHRPGQSQNMSASDNSASLPFRNDAFEKRGLVPPPVHGAASDQPQFDSSGTGPQMTAGEPPAKRHMDQRLPLQKDENLNDPRRVPSQSHVSGQEAGPSHSSLRNESWREREKAAQSRQPADHRPWETPKSEKHNGPSGVASTRKPLLAMAHPPEPKQSEMGHDGLHEGAPIGLLPGSRPMSLLSGLSPPPVPHGGQPIPPVSRGGQPLPPVSHGGLPLPPVSHGGPLRPPAGIPNNMLDVHHQNGMPPNFAASNCIPSYIELSRLPTEMLRPANLEQFLRPRKPLTLSSVKVVYSSEGVHLHTLVKFDDPRDGLDILKRDGEQGIRVRPASQRTFDEAVDGIPAVTLPLRSRNSPTSERRRRSRSRSPRRRSGEVPHRRGGRDGGRLSGRDRKRGRSRSNTPDRSRGGRRRSRSPPRKPPKDPRRWCVVLTNVPFRVTEEELMAWLTQRVKPTRIVRTFYADGNASDRWLAEFETESQMERALSIKTQLRDRNIKMRYVDNEYADEIMSIEDKYGESRKTQCEIEQMKEELEKARNLLLETTQQVAVAAPMGIHFPSVRGRGAPRGRGNLIPPPMPSGMMVSQHLPGLGFPPGSSGRGGPFRGGRPPFHGPPRGWSEESGFRGGGPRGAFRNGGPLPPQMHPERENGSDQQTSLPLDPNLIATLGPPGTVVACNGFPHSITMPDVMMFFGGFPVDESSVRIRVGDDHVPTGECLLSISDPEQARIAVQKLSGEKMGDNCVSLMLANP